MDKTVDVGETLYSFISEAQREFKISCINSVQEVNRGLLGTRLLKGLNASTQLSRFACNLHWVVICV